MKRLGLYRDLRFLAHQNNGGHPECPARLEAIERALSLSADLIPWLVDLKSSEATEDQLAAAHEADYLDWLNLLDERTTRAQARIQVDPDTHFNLATWQAARLAAGVGVAAVELLKDSGFSSTFALVRPPGHHALKRQAMGFCFLNNIAVAARHCLALGYNRVLVLDIDVHHGNGTQEIFWTDPGVLFITLQKYPQWPGTGWFTEDGAGDGKGFNVNIPLPAGTGDTGYLRAFEQIVVPTALQYRPEIILLSAGYDAHERDPLGGQRVTTGGFAALAGKVVNLADTLGVKVAAFLEGGYDPEALAECVIGTMRAFTGTAVHEPSMVLSVDASPRAVADHIRSTRRHLATYWRCLQ